MAKNPNNPDLSPKFIFWFWFIPAVCVWVVMNFIIFGDSTITYPEFDGSGKPVDPQNYQNYLLFGEKSNSDFPFWSRVAVSLIFLMFLVYWGIRLQVEMWGFRKVTHAAQKLFK